MEQMLLIELISKIITKINIMNIEYIIHYIINLPLAQVGYASILYEFSLFEQ